ncbi:GTP-binding protein [Williamsia deligens]
MVSGFLGAGKTTMVNHLLRSRSGARIGVVVNDFGDVSIDALLVAGAVDGAVRLGNGCICCTADADTLGEVLGGLVAPAAGLDAVLVETSGLAEPAAVARMVIATADPRIGYGGLVYLVDAENLDALRPDNPEIDRHIALADLLVVNKVDRVDARTRDRVLDGVRALNPTAAVVATVDGAVDPGLLLDIPDDRDTGPRQLELADLLVAGDDETGHDDHHHAHTRYESLSVTADRPLHPRRLAAFLERPPAGVYRIKGVVELAGADRHRLVVHAVGGLLDVTTAPGRRASAQRSVRQSDLVAIGAGMDAPTVRATLQELETRTDETVDAQAALGVTRHLRTPTPRRAGAQT